MQADHEVAYPPGSEIGTGGNVAPQIPEPQRFSRVYRARGDLINHILVSHTLVGLIPDGTVTTHTHRAGTVDHRRPPGPP